MRNVRLFYEERSDEVMYVDELETMFTEKLQEYAHRFSSTPGSKREGERGRREGGRITSTNLNPLGRIEIVRCPHFRSC